MTQSIEPRYRPIRFGIEDVVLEREADGVIRIRSTPALAAYPQRLSDRLLHWAAVAPERTFMARRRNGGDWQVITYAQALQHARAIGEALLLAGLSAQRPLVILSENDLDHAMLALGAAHAGVAYAPISPAYSTVSQDHEKLRHIIRLLTPGMVYAISGSRYGKAIAATIDPAIPLVVSQDPPAGRANVRLFSELAATRATAAIDAAREATGPDTIVKFLFTSGSTSLPKAVINTQRMMCSNLQTITQALPFLAHEPPVLVDWLPWNHTFGGNHNVGLTLFHGGSLYIDDGKPVPALFGETLRNLREVAPTIYFNVPKGFEALVQALRQDEALCGTFFSRVKMFFYSGAGLSQPVWDSLHELAERTVGERIAIGTGLGMTETAPSDLFTNRYDVRSGMIGVPCADVHLKLVPSEGKLAIRYKGPNVTPGYWRSPQATRDAFDEEGYFQSGDAVRFVDERRPELGFVFDGRIAEDFKLATGTWVSVGPLRARVIAAGDPYVQDVVVAGINRDEVGVLLIPHADSCRRLAADVPAGAPMEQVLASAPVRSMVAKLLHTLEASATGSATRITRALLLVEPPSIDRGEVTDKGSINQRAVLTHRAALVDAMYDESNAAVIRPAAN